MVIEWVFSGLAWAMKLATSESPKFDSRLMEQGDLNLCRLFMNPSFFPFCWSTWNS